MSEYKKIEEEVKEAIKQGSSIEAIKQGLLNAGYNESDINDIINVVEARVPEPEKKVTNESPKPQNNIFNDSSRPKEEKHSELALSTTKEIITSKSSVTEEAKTSVNQIPATEKPLGESVALPDPITEEVKTPIGNMITSEKPSEPVSVTKAEEKLNIKPVPDNSKSSIPMNNPFKNSGVGYNPQREEDPIIQKNKPIITEESTKKKGGTLKFLLMFFIILLIGAGAVYGYSKYDPFFMKSKESVLRNIITNTQESLIGGGYEIDTISNYKSEIDGETFDFDFPIEYKIESFVDDKFPNQSLVIGDVDLDPVLNFLSKMFGGVVESTESEIDNTINVELRYSDSMFYSVLNKAPESINVFMDVDYLIGKWISYELGDIEKIIGYEKPELDDEESQKIIEEIIDFILVKTDPKITSDMDIEGRRVTYETDLSKFAIATENEDIEEGAWNDNPVYRERQEKTIEKLKELDGYVQIEILVGRDFVIKEFGIYTESKDDNLGEAWEVSLEGIINYNTIVDISAPSEYMTQEEFEEYIMIQIVENVEPNNENK